MHVAIIATRHFVPPPPPIFQYRGQLAGLVNTFGCIAVELQALTLPLDRVLRQKMSLSVPGYESTLDELNRAYYKILSQNASDDANFLSTNIAVAIDAANRLTTQLQSLPASSTATDLQQRLARFLSALNAQGVKIN